ncbi:uncharacterized protein ACA1_234190 [Acanthamoeba castellanii str. Neff]|uniref:Uncharacterized protein n=1 Tax=Acanthamoeba castellanii (strain ATCC 30010 / Neff) TaxID=1257118 RepID=L8H3I1_ACACF|nr:uncharacterized protein ACA1_234190 [Acanthamoeba castellanii str. Neff]ELR18981.1 hypothetical protein ACA1_234190 [Acanthamoeba castellanii str. Neff]
MVQTAVAQVNCPLHFMISYFAVRTKDDNIWAISLCTGDMQNAATNLIQPFQVGLSVHFL